MKFHKMSEKELKKAKAGPKRTKQHELVLKIMGAAEASLREDGHKEPGAALGLMMLFATGSLIDGLPRHEWLPLLDGVVANFRKAFRVPGEENGVKSAIENATKAMVVED